MTDPSWRQAGDCSKLPASSIAGSPSSSERAKWITSRSLLLFGSYRRDDFAAPETYLASLGVLLERYPDYVVERVSDPTSGLQRSSKFPPTIAEVVEACDEIVRRETFSSRWQAQAERQLAERAVFEREREAETPEHRRAVVERALGHLRDAGFRQADGAPIAGPWREPERPLSWKPCTDEELRKLYPPAQAKEAAAP